MVATGTARQGRRSFFSYRKSLALILASASAVASVQGAPGIVARRAFLDKVPFRNSKRPVKRGGSVDEGIQDANATIVEVEDTINNLLDNETQQEEAIAISTREPGAWPCMDDLDRTLIKISLPVILNFAIAPVVQAVDLVFLNRLGNALAVAGQAAANQVFGSVFWLTSFIPSSEYFYLGQFIGSLPVYMPSIRTTTAESLTFELL